MTQPIHVEPFRLTVVQAHEVTSTASHFRCTPMANDSGDAPIISGRCCLLRQARARRSIGGDTLRVCADCPLGKMVEELCGGPVELGAYDGKNEAARKRGGDKGKGAMVRWARRGEG